MRKIIILAVALIAGGLAFPTTAEARSHRIGHSHTYISGYLSCGTPIYTKRIIIGFDRYNRPVYRYHRVQQQRRHYRPARIQPRQHYQQPRYQSQRRNTYRNHGYRDYRRSQRRGRSRT